jgi:ubiquitin carboxyl-terminal hydrolase L5
MVMNIQEVELGEELQNFKDFTATLIPPDRGQVIENFDFVRNIHNSFAR